MIKKIVNTIILSLLVFFTISNKKLVVNAETNSNTEITTHAKYVDAMGTQIGLFIYNKDENFDRYVELFEEAQSIIYELDYLTSNFEMPVFDDIYNVYYINKHPLEKIEITKTLYDILVYAEEIKQKTDGYFDISIGLIIDQWKYLINETTVNKPLSKKELKAFIENVNKIPVIEDGILLEENDGKYFVQIKEGVKLDLGAFAKGYAVKKVKEYFESENVKYYKILGSDSSLQYGISNNESKNNLFEVGISDTDGQIYGTILVNNTSVTTSGDIIQGVKYGKKIYHHIVSPKTKTPESFNRLITLIHDDAAYADALSTALFSMPDDVREEWLKNNESDLQYILYKANGKVINTFSDDIFTQLKGGDNLKTQFRDWLIISGIIIIAILAFVMIGKPNNKKYRQAEIIYRSELIAIVRFDLKKVEIVKEQAQNNEKTYPIIDEENQTITLLGDYKINNVRQELIIKYNFEERSMQIIKEQSPNNICSNLGKSTSKELICIPNNVRVRFTNGSIDIDDAV